MNPVVRFLLKLLFKIFYIGGLTGLIPAVFLYLAPEPSLNMKIFLASVLFLIIGIMGVFLTYAEARETLRSLGLFTLVPGLISLVFMVFGKKTVIGYVKESFVGYEHIDPLIQVYLQKWVPTLGILTVIYLLLGGTLFFLGKKRTKP